MIIGKNVDTKEDVKIDINTLVRTRGLIQASSGGGKSWIIRRLLEQTNGKVQQIVIDLDGEFESLREKYDYLLVAKNGDVPADIKTADLMARRLLELEVSAIIDISELKHHERVLYVKRFLDSLINAPKKLWHPCLVIVDEAHQFCPQGAKSDSASSVIDLMTRGRKRGFCGILATQRISKLNKDASAEGRNRFIGLAVQDVDRKRASEELGFTSKEDEISLRKLEDGEFFIFGPAISKEVIKVKVGGVSTTHPDVSKEELKLEPTKTPSAITKILKDVADIEKEAEEELRTVQDYKNKVSELTRELTMAKKGNVPQQAKVDYQAIEKAKEKSKQEGFKEAERQFYPERARYQKDINSLKEFIQQFTIKGSKLLQLEVPQTEVKSIIMQKIEPIKNIQKVSKEIPMSYESDTNQTLGICARKIYSFLFHNSDRTFTKAQVGAVTGYSNKSGGFSNALSELNTAGLIDRVGGNLKVRELNPSVAGNFDFSREAIIQKLSKCETEIYNLLLENPTREFSKEELANETPSQYSHGSGGFSNALSKLNTLGLIQRNGGTIKLNPDLLELM